MRLNSSPSPNIRTWTMPTKLSRPAYQPLSSGVQLSVTGQQLKSSHAVRRIVRYEQIIIDNNFKRFRRRFSIFASALFAHFLGGAAVSKSVLSVNYKTQFQPFKEKVSVAQEGYTVAYQANNKVLRDHSYLFQRSRCS